MWTQRHRELEAEYIADYISRILTWRQRRADARVRVKDHWRHLDRFAVGFPWDHMMPTLHHRLRGSDPPALPRDWVARFVGRQAWDPAILS